MHESNAPYEGQMRTEVYDAEATKLDNARAVARCVTLVAQWNHESQDGSRDFIQKMLLMRVAAQLDQALKIAEPVKPALIELTLEEVEVVLPILEEALASSTEQGETNTLVHLVDYIKTEVQ